MLVLTVWDSGKRGCRHLYAFALQSLCFCTTISMLSHSHLYAFVILAIKRHDYRRIIACRMTLQRWRKEADVMSAFYHT